MVATLFGVIYSTQNAIVRRYVYVDDNSELTPALCNPGESLVTVRRGPYANSAAWAKAVSDAVTTAAGKPPGDPRCCVVNASNVVVSIIYADSGIDAIPNTTLVQAYTTIPVGSTYNPATGLFTAPAINVPAYAGDPEHPPADALYIPPTVIPKP